MIVGRICFHSLTSSVVLAKTAAEKGEFNNRGGIVIDISGLAAVFIVGTWFPAELLLSGSSSCCSTRLPKH